VVLKDGSEYLARVVASNADAHITFQKLLDPKLLPAEFAAAIERISYDSASLKSMWRCQNFPISRRSRRASRAAPSRHDSHLSRSRLHRARL